MKSAIALRHVAFEDLGILEPLLKSRGYAVRYVDAPIGDLAAIDMAAADLVVVLGAPIGAFDEANYPFLVAELDAVKRRLAARRPLLGICLGAQIIARVLGADVRPMGRKEIGFSPLALTAAGKNSPLAALDGVPVLHWHGDEFQIPVHATRLAFTEDCANQAFSLGREVLALQFHLEADHARLEQWLVGHACELGQAGIDPREMRQQAAACHHQVSEVASRVIADWLARIEMPCDGSVV